MAARSLQLRVPGRHTLPGLPGSKSSWGEVWLPGGGPRGEGFLWGGPWEPCSEAMPNRRPKSPMDGEVGQKVEDRGWGRSRETQTGISAARELVWVFSL